VSSIAHGGFLPQDGFWITLAPMKTITHIGAVITLFTALALVAGCANWGKEEDKTRDWSAARLYEEAKANLENGDYEKAIDYYQKLESRFPFGMLAQQAQLDIAYAYYKYDEPASAIAAAERFIKLHPRHPNVDYAYYLRGLVHFTQGRNFFDRFIPRDMSLRDPGAARESFDAFSELVRRFPNSRYSKDAAQRMVYLKNMLARHEIHVANYYMRRGAYVAAANRARYVLENFQRTPAVPDALVVMAKAYSGMGLDELAADSVRVLRLNYPNYQGISEIGDLNGK
jgi:outer membrane protein assembly factor BamD